MIAEVLRMMLALGLVCFHRQVADFILDRDRELVSLLARRGILLPPLPTRGFTQNLYFAVGIFAALWCMGRIWMSL